MKSFKKVEFEDGVAIIKQGDPGDLFYILESGTADISISGKGSVMKASKVRVPYGLQVAGCVRRWDCVCLRPCASLRALRC